LSEHLKEVGWYLDRQAPDNVLRQLASLPPNYRALRGHYQKLVESPDEILRIGGLAQLLSLGILPRNLWETAVTLADRGAVRSRAFDFFLRNDETEWAREVLAVPFDAADDFAERLMHLRLAHDRAGELHLEATEFLRDGNADHLATAVELAEATGGWRAALPWAVRVLMMAPNEGMAFRLLNLLKQANQLVVLRKALDAFRAAGRFPAVHAIFTAALQLGEEQPAAALAILANQRERAPDNYTQAYIEMIRAEASEALGKFAEAHHYYVTMNEERRFVRPGVVQPNVDAKRYVDRVAASDSLLAEPLPGDSRNNHYAMVGFPRSGTTLLENALAAHPDIETLEEVPSSLTALAHLEAAPHRPATEAEGVAAREVYYRSIDEHRSKRQASVVIDKMPLESASAPLLVKLFPGRRYIFSIRDPRDVVLSCFKTNFLPNDAMENFRTLAGACRLYDFSLSRWFAHFSLADERVCYVRYERLVTDFDAEVRRVLAFVGVPWHPAIRKFAEIAHKRQATTPSYEKVRKGLTLGIQSSWRNYRFLFAGDEGKTLAKWVEFLGYESGERGEAAITSEGSAGARA
jgi:hypothetical protein